MSRDYEQIRWDAQLEDDCRQLIRLAIREDLDRLYDWTTVALVGDEAPGRAVVRARKPGVIAGLQAAELALAEYDTAIQWSPSIADGQKVAAGTEIAVVAGPARSLLTAERTVLNLLGRLSGVATLTRDFVAAVAGTDARIYDTRKTMPGWRRLDKLAVRLGGGWNHRLGLYDGILIKDNHLAFAARETKVTTPSAAIQRCRQFMASLTDFGNAANVPIAIEVDTLAQFEEVLPHDPQIVLLDNMSLEDLATAVQWRNARNAHVQLEASGGVTLDTVADIARTGVDRISVGMLTHSATWLDIALDWD